ncbi:MAG TPA: molybdopterin converting factor subunit 1 [Hyphomicrobium sp.]|nr:molybdopterin converting factor subunit 1 [Hyphomicrobium sp.]
MSTNTHGREITVRYFAWLREKTGISEERVTVSDKVATVADLVAWLRVRGPEFEAAFSHPGTVRAAVDHAHAKPHASIAQAREVAFFPPVTGG